MKEAIAEYYETRTRRITGVCIAANLAFFAVLLAAMFYLRWVSEEWPVPFHFASLLMAAAMTMFALCASATMAVGARAARLNDIEPAVRWIAIAISSWFVFLFLEIVEWVRLVYLEHLGPGTSFGSTFLLLTGTHWFAAALCVGWFTVVATDVRRHDVLAAAMYSHFLNFWWLVLVFCLYFANANLDGV
jgi:heme/copper-type cytochrome/quinol oxidase subunit 3